MTVDWEEQIAHLTAVHRGLTSVVGCGSEVVISGTLSFEASAKGCETITEAFEIELIVPRSFPEALPVARETAGGIDPSYSHRYENGNFCLAVPVEERRIFSQDPSLLGFVNNLVIPYLYGYCYFRKHGVHPFGEAEHGGEGIVGYYRDKLGLADDLASLSVIAFLFEHGYRGHHDCPCGSGLKVRDCHGPTLHSLHQHHTPQTLFNEFAYIVTFFFERQRKGDLVWPRRLEIQIDRIRRRNKRLDSHLNTLLLPRRHASQGN